MSSMVTAMIFNSILSVILFLSLLSPASAKEPELKFPQARLADYQKLYDKVTPQIEAFVRGVKKEGGPDWEKLCEAKEGITFRYLGKYTTHLSCNEWSVLFKDKKERWWGRSGATGLPITGTFKKIWYPKVGEVAKNYDTIGVDVFVHDGNVKNESMKKTDFVDLTWQGPKEYGDNGWESLRLFFVYKNGQWFLKGFDLYHWTI